MSADPHHHYMSLALQLAAEGRYTVSPNPMVGCVLVKEGHVIGRGYHKQAGDAHAEIVALKEAGTLAEGATMYVSLEPCCHTGRTPPCTNAIRSAQLQKVVVACLDPNPLVAGKGVHALQAAGIEVEVGVMETEAKQLNSHFFHYITTKRPFVIAKWAMSLDGKTITHTQDSRAISGQESMQNCHQTRQQVDAILIGAKTAIQDNPLLTARYSSSAIHKQPIRIILASRGQLPLDLNVFSASLPAKTIVAITAETDAAWCQALRDKNIECMLVNATPDGRVDLTHLLDLLGERQITSLLVEGGMTIHESFIRENLVNQFQVYIAPVIIGTLSQKKPLALMTVSPLGTDICVTASDEEKLYV